ncbi:MAG: hypothetical protein WB711_09270 [Terriglobales bacterium]
MRARNTGSRRHEEVKEEDIHDHRPENDQRQRHKTVDQQQQPSDGLNRENDDIEMGGEEYASKLTGKARRRRRWNELKKSVQAENDKNQPHKQTRNQRSDFHLKPLADRSVTVSSNEAQHILI